MNRRLQQIIPAIQTSDGAGVRLRRSLGQSQQARLDPFLMLDEFSSDNPDDYIAGFPPHPHRGFETVTYMLEGHMLHEDHLGNRGHLNSGAVQWMTAGRGIIHSEMPQQERGLLRGFQLWINLPAAEKMKPAAYRDIGPEEIPVASLGAGGSVKVIAGTCALPGAAGPLVGPVRGISTEPLFFDVGLQSGQAFEHPLPPDHHAFAYVFEGSLVAEDGGLQQDVQAHLAGVLGHGDQVRLKAGPGGARFLLLAARPLREPVVQYGPFVMNTREQIEQALQDYRDGVLA